MGGRCFFIREQMGQTGGGGVSIVNLLFIVDPHVDSRNIHKNKIYYIEGENKNVNGKSTAIYDTRLLAPKYPKMDYGKYGN